MTTNLLTALLWVAALGSGLMAGVYFAFSTFIMRAFNNLEPAQATAAMNAINTTILRSLFMPLFFGSSIVSLLLVVLGLVRWGEPGATVTLLAGAIFLLGMFACTALFNVPLNNALATLEPNSSEALQLWPKYLKSWTSWNHLRTLSSLSSCGLCIWLLRVSGTAG